MLPAWRAPEDAEIIRQLRAAHLMGPDANAPLYALDETSPHHAAARRWLEQVLSGIETVGHRVIGGSPLNQALRPEPGATP